MNNFLLGIGAQKAGTTWLANYLSQHSEVFVSPLKEMHFFNSIYAEKYCKNYDSRFNEKIKKVNLDRITLLDLHLAHRIHIERNLGKYKKYFEMNSIGMQLVGEITPAYSLLSTSGFKIINKHFPNVKIIYIIRNPIDRFWSALRFTSKSNKDFVPLKSFNQYLRNENYVQRGNYKSTIEKLEVVFTNDKFKVIFYEDLFNPEKHIQTLKSITNFLCISYKKSNLNEISNPSVTNELPLKLQIQGIKHFESVYKFCFQYFTDKQPIPQEWLKSYSLLKE